MLVSLVLLVLSAGQGLVSVADTVVLKDGRALTGLVEEPPPRAGGVGIVVPRAKAEKEWPELVKRADDLAKPAQKQAKTESLKRLKLWKSERRSTGDDRLAKWLDQAIETLEKGDEPAKSKLVELRLKPNEVKSVTKRDKESRAKLAKAWQVGLEDVEELSLEDLNQALESRGVDPKTISTTASPALLKAAPTRETDEHWLVRRAATEVKHDKGLRFLRYETILMLEPNPGEQPNLQTALGSLGGLGALLSGEVPPDPWPARLREVEAKGNVGAVLTTMKMSPDFAQVSVEIALWVKLAPNRWVISGSRSGVVRTDARPANQGADLAADPQVKAVFNLFEGLGLGQLPPEIKQRSLNVGAATQHALGMARESADRDLRDLEIDLTKPTP